MKKKLALQKTTRWCLTNKVIEKYKGEDEEPSMKLDCCTVDPSFKLIARIMLTS